MPRIDALLAAMVKNRATAVRLADGDVAYLVIGDAEHPLTRQPLGEGQLFALLKEMVPVHLADVLSSGGPAEFTYAGPDGTFVTRLVTENGKPTATVQLARVNGGNGNGTNGSNGHAPAASNGHNGAHAAAPAPVAAATAAPDPPVTREQEPPAIAPAPPEKPATSFASAEVVVSDSSLEPARSEINDLLRGIVTNAASDLHLRVGEPPIYRIHGELKRMTDADMLVNSRLEALLSAIMPERNRAEYREVNDTDFAYEIPGLARFRCNAFREHHGSGAVFRVIPHKVATVEEMGITPEVQNLCYLTKGLVLVTGPTGSGKSTTLGALVDLINRSRDDHVITIEDPIEFVHVNKRCVITQRQVGLHTGGFKSALRAALREDPDIVLVGEMRDLETVSIALETAETGHLVFGTLHTTTAVGTIDRVIDQFPADRQAQIRVMLADTLKGVISQTLCKKIGGGRVAVREILLSVPAVANLIREGKAFQIPSVMQTSRKLGMVLINDVLIDLVDNGIVEPKEAYMKATDKQSFLAVLKARGHDTAFLM
jgi:twitching motility protein PilT